MNELKCYHYFIIINYYYYYYLFIIVWGGWETETEVRHVFLGDGGGGGGGGRGSNRGAWVGSGRVATDLIWDWGLYPPSLTFQFICKIGLAKDVFYGILQCTSYTY